MTTTEILAVVKSGKAEFDYPEMIKNLAIDPLLDFVTIMSTPEGFHSVSIRNEDSNLDKYLIWKKPEFNSLIDWMTN